MPRVAALLLLFGSVTQSSGQGLHHMCVCLQMELRYNEVDRAREIFELYVRCHPDVKAWVRYAKFEMKNSEIGLARAAYERAVEELGEDAQTVSHPTPSNFAVLSVCILLVFWWNFQI